MNHHTIVTSTEHARLCVRIALVVLSTCQINAYAADRTAESSLPSQLDLPRLVDTAASKLNLRIVYDSQFASSAKVTLRQPGPIADEQLWALTNQLLAEQGYTTIAAGPVGIGSRTADRGTGIGVGAGQGGGGNTNVPGAAAVPDTHHAANDNVGVLSVVKFAEAQQRARIETLEEYATPLATPPGFRRVLVRLDRASGKDIAAMVQLLMSKPAGSVNEFGKDNLLLVGDVQPHLGRTLALIREMDSDTGGSIIKEFECKNVDPSRLVTLIKQVTDKQKAAGVHDLRGEVMVGAGGSGQRVLIIAPKSTVPLWEALITQVDRVEPVERRTYSVQSFGLKEVSSLIEQTIKPGKSALGGGAGGGGSDDGRWRVIHDDLTGSLIVTALPGEHEQIEQLMQRLAALPPEARRPVRTFKIKNRGVKEMRAALIDLLNAGVFDSGGLIDSPSTSGGASSSSVVTSTNASTQTSLTQPRAAGSSGPATRATGSGASPGDPASQPQAPSSSSDERGVRDFPLGPARGPAANRRADQLTLTADEPTNTLIAVGDPRILAQIEQLLPTLDVRQAQIMLDAYLVSLSESQSVDFGVELERLQVNGDTLLRLSSLFGLASGTAGARTVPDRNGFTGAVLDPGDFSVVVRALEGISKGRSLSNPRVLVSNNEQATFNSVLQQPFASTSTAAGVSSQTSFGGTQDAGTTISVKPQVAQGDHVVLNYSVSLSSFVGTATDPNLPPPRQQNNVQSIVTIPDGYTVVVGGLEVQTQGDTKTQVPIVGSIPLLGELFKNSSASTSKNRFFVFLRASVMRNANLDDLKYVSQSPLEHSTIDDGVPDVVPQIIR